MGCHWALAETAIDNYGSAHGILELGTFCKKLQVPKSHVLIHSCK